MNGFFRGYIFSMAENLSEIFASVNFIQCTGSRHGAPYTCVTRWQLPVSGALFYRCHVADKLFGSARPQQQQQQQQQQTPHLPILLSPFSPSFLRFLSTHLHHATTTTQTTKMKTRGIRQPHFFSPFLFNTLVNDNNNKQEAQGRRKTTIHDTRLGRSTSEPNIPMRCCGLSIIPASFEYGKYFTDNGDHRPNHDHRFRSTTTQATPSSEMTWRSQSKLVIFAFMSEHDANMTYENMTCGVQGTRKDLFVIGIWKTVQDWTNFTRNDTHMSAKVTLASGHSTYGNPRQHPELRMAVCSVRLIINDKGFDTNITVSSELGFSTDPFDEKEPPL
ncbi:hypothetical protein DFH27DRAFT_527842 [Peziza echinospora]|nr:hypothetical protein DFH27DRAFT_527842 [Peziza echinospora]